MLKNPKSKISTLFSIRKIALASVIVLSVECAAQSTPSLEESATQAQNTMIKGLMTMFMGGDMGAMFQKAQILAELWQLVGTDNVRVADVNAKVNSLGGLVVPEQKYRIEQLRTAALGFVRRWGSVPSASPQKQEALAAIKGDIQTQIRALTMREDQRGQNALDDMVAQNRALSEPSTDGRTAASIKDVLDGSPAVAAWMKNFLGSRPHLNEEYDNGIKQAEGRELRTNCLNAAGAALKYRGDPRHLIVFFQPPFDSQSREALIKVCNTVWDLSHLQALETLRAVYAGLQ